MGRTAKTKYTIVGGTMATFYVTEEIYIDGRRKVHLALMGIRLRKYIELRVLLHKAG